MAATHDFTVDQGTTAIFTVSWENSDGSTRSINGYDAVLHIEDVAEDPSTDNGDLTIADDMIEVSIPASKTDTWTFKEAPYNLDITSPGGIVSRLLRGKIKVVSKVDE